MNHARWLFCHQMMMDAERRELKRFARLLGTDLTMFSSSAEKAEQASGFEPVRCFPLAAVLAPDAYARLASQDINIEDNEIPEEDYERRAAELEASGGITQIDVLSATIDEKMKGLRSGRTKMQMQADRLPIWDPGSGLPPPGADPPAPPAVRLRMRSDRGS